MNKKVKGLIILVLSVLIAIGVVRFVAPDVFQPTENIFKQDTITLKNDTING